jgi:ABC-type amino acid transport substrate-binding protein
VLDLSVPYFLSVSMILSLRESYSKGVSDLQGKKVAMIEGSLQE